LSKPRIVISCPEINQRRVVAFFAGEAVRGEVIPGASGAQEAEYVPGEMRFLEASAIGDGDRTAERVLMNVVGCRADDGVEQVVSVHVVRCGAVRGLFEHLRDFWKSIDDVGSGHAVLRSLNPPAVAVVREIGRHPVRIRRRKEPLQVPAVTAATVIYQSAVLVV